MQLKVFRNDIIDGLQKSSAIIPAKTGAAFLRTIWLEAASGVLRILSTDSSLEFTGQYAAKVTEEGLCGVQGKNFFELVRKLPPGEIGLTLDRNEARGDRQATIAIATAKAPVLTDWLAGLEAQGFVVDQLTITPAADGTVGMTAELRKGGQ